MQYYSFAFIPIGLYSFSLFFVGSEYAPTRQCTFHFRLHTIVSRFCSLPFHSFLNHSQFSSFSVDYNSLADHFLRSWKDCLPEREGGFLGGTYRCVAEFHPQCSIRNPWGTNLYLRCSERRCWRFKSSELFRCLDWQIVADSCGRIVVTSWSDLLGQLHDSEDSWPWRWLQYDVSKHWQLFTSLDSVTSLREVCLMIRHSLKYV